MYISAAAALYLKVQSFWNENCLGFFFVKIISIPDEELFSETPVGYILCLKYMIFPLVL